MCGDACIPPAWRASPCASAGTRAKAGNRSARARREPLTAKWVRREEKRCSNRKFMRYETRRNTRVHTRRQKSSASLGREYSRQTKKNSGEGVRGSCLMQLQRTDRGKIRNEKGTWGGRHRSQVPWPWWRRRCRLGGEGSGVEVGGLPRGQPGETQGGRKGERKGSRTTLKAHAWINAHEAKEAE